MSPAAISCLDSASDEHSNKLRFSDFDSKVSRLLATPVFHFCLEEGVLVQIWMLRSYVCRPKGGLLGEILSSRHVEVN